MILGQEVAKAIDFPDEIEGHRVITGAPIGGARIPGIFVCKEWAPFIVEPPMICGKAIGLQLSHPTIGELYVVTAHLSATTSREDYETSLADFRHVIASVPSDADVICGVDANTSF